MTIMRALDSHIHDGGLFIDFDGTKLGRSDVAGLISCSNCGLALTRYPCEREFCECGSGLHDMCCCGTWMDAEQFEMRVMK